VGGPEHAVSAAAVMTISLVTTCLLDLILFLSPPSDVVGIVAKPGRSLSDIRGMVDPAMHDVPG
jgi:hypothetical protein